MSIFDKFKETSKNKKILIAVIAVLVVGGGTTVGILVHNNSDKPSKAEVSSVDDNITAEVDDTTENEKTSSEDEAETTNIEAPTEQTTTTTPEASTENTETEAVTGGSENSGGDDSESEGQAPVSTQTSVVTQPPVQTTAKPVQTTVSTTKAPVVTTTVATQPAVDNSSSINESGYYGQPWDSVEGGYGYIWVSSTRYVKYNFQTGAIAIDEDISSVYNDFMYVYNNEISCGKTVGNSIGMAGKYCRSISTYGRENVLYTNDIEDDGICSSSWGVWVTQDGENYRAV